MYIPLLYCTCFLTKLNLATIKKLQCSLLLQAPFKNFRALNYGAIGLVIGHEITHGFDVGGGVINVDFYENKKDFLGNFTSLNSIITGSLFDQPKKLSETWLSRGHFWRQSVTRHLIININTAQTKHFRESKSV